MHGASLSWSSSPRRRLRHHHHAGAVCSAPHCCHRYGHGDEAHVVGLVAVVRGSQWDTAAADGADSAAAGALGYDARVTAAMTKTAVVRDAQGGGASDGGDGSSEDGVLLPAPPRMAITKRTDVVVMR